MSRQSIKYPVISRSNNEYHVEIAECRYFNNHYEIGIYKKYKGFFNRDRYQLLNKGLFGNLISYDARKYDFDLVLMVKSIIDNMESKWSELENDEKFKNSQFEKFDEWDGKC